MLAEQANPAAAVADHLPVEPGKTVAGDVAHGHARSEEARHSRPAEAVIELHILAGVEGLIEVADGLEDTLAVGDGHALRRDHALAIGVDVRGRMMAQPRG